VALALPLGFGLACVLNQPIRFRGFFRTILILPWLVSNLVVALLWAWLLNGQFGPHRLSGFAHGRGRCPTR
jgi:ABC-type sugar transport system permease subunit